MPIKTKILGSYDTHTPDKEGHEYGKCICDPETETICSIDYSQKVNQDFKVNGIKYQLDTEHEDDLSSSDTAVKPKLQHPPQFKLDLAEV